MADNTAAFMALDRESQGAIAPYQSGVDMTGARSSMLALLSKINVMFPWAPPGLSSIGSRVFDLGAFPRLRAYLPGGGARPAWLADEAKYQQWRKMIEQLYRPIDTAFLKQNSALTAAETQAAANNVAFWDDVYKTTDTINMASPLRIGMNLRESYESSPKTFTAVVAAGALAVTGIFAYFMFRKPRRK